MSIAYSGFYTEAFGFSVLALNWALLDWTRRRPIEVTRRRIDLMWHCAEGNRLCLGCSDCDDTGLHLFALTIVRLHLPCAMSTAEVESKECVGGCAFSYCSVAALLLWSALD